MMLLRNRKLTGRPVVSRRKVQRVGVNDVDHPVTRYITIDGKRKKWRCPFYQTWNNMLVRCYGGRPGRPTYEGCTVCKEWLSFSNFRLWMCGQRWMMFDNNGKAIRLQLDKDFLSGEKRGKIYSPETCVFISQGLNSFLLDSKALRGKYPLGVSLKGRYLSKIRNPFTRQEECLGYFDTPEEAQKAYIKRKTEFAVKLAAEQTDERIRDALLKIDWSK